MNSSGPISLGGTTAGQSIEIENGGPGTAQISLNDTAVRTLAGVPSGAIVMPTNFYGKSNNVTINITISSSTQNYCVYSAVSSNPGYVAGKTAAIVTINSGVSIGSGGTGSYAMLVPASFNPGDTVTIVNNGTIVGAGGSGGAGSSNGTGCNGAGAGSALYVNRPTTVTNNGTVASGGGGGGGGGYSTRGCCTGRSVGGGGGGGAGSNFGSGGPAVNNGPPAQHPSPGNPGSPGTANTGGGGGSGQTWTGPRGSNSGQGGSGGSGGGLGSPGSTGGTGNSTNSPTGAGGAGGSTGNYITGNPFVTWPATGTRLGGVA
jgi:hypothetical protein